MAIVPYLKYLRFWWQNVRQKFEVYFSILQGENRK